MPGWTPFYLQNCLNSSCHRFNKVLETFLRDFGPYCHDSITQLLQICRLHIHDANLCSTTSQRCSIDWDLVTVEAIWVKWTHCHVQETSLRWFELCDMVHYPAGSTSEDGTHRAGRYDDMHRIDEIKSISFHIMFYRLFRGAAKYIVYGNTFSSFSLSDCDLYTSPTTGDVKRRQNDQPGQNKELVPKRGTTSVAWSRV